jgi:hypothetical protein
MGLLLGLAALAVGQRFKPPTLPDRELQGRAILEALLLVMNQVAGAAQVR